MERLLGLMALDKDRTEATALSRKHVLGEEGAWLEARQRLQPRLWVSAGLRNYFE